MNHTARPTQITDILEKVSADYPADMATSLETYISSLEANQQTMPFKISVSDPTRLYWQGIKRQQSRRERALKKLTNYQ